jgi:threonylcarbamoyladenosine tRNA methylthiotransferase MtaB
VPYVRGQERSFPPEQVITEIKTRVAQGYKEVTLTGTRIGSYGQDRTTPESHITLEQLIVRILNETRIERLRLSSLQLQNLTSGLFNLLKKERLCRHIHISLQSGCDRTLQRMRRRYSTTDYQQAISSARQAIHGLAVTTDVIVGFPGETDAEFDESYQFCRDMNFARIHVFPYSLREGTAAAKMPDQVPEMIKRERTLKMLTLAQESAHIFRTQFTGKTITALWEKNTGNDLWSGLTDNYIRVFTTSKEILTNRPLPVKLSTETANGMLGTLVN